VVGWDMHITVKAIRFTIFQSHKNPISDKKSTGMALGFYGFDISIAA
jgi:hypothetical protein